jgi:O-Antigen ligase
MNASDLEHRAGTRLLLFGHILAYSGLILSAGLQQEELRYVTYAGAACQVLAGLPSFGLNVIQRFRASGVLLMTILYLAFAAVVGWVRGNWFSFWGLDVVCFGILASISLCSLPVVQERLRRLYRILLFPGLIVATYLMTHVSPGSAEGRIVTDLPSSVSQIGSLALPSFLILFQRNLLRKEIVVIVWGLAIVCVFSIFTASRGAALVVPTAIFLRFVLFRQSRLTSILLVFCAAAIVFAAVFGAVDSSYSGAVKESVAYVENRFQPDEGTDFTSGRNDEAAYFLHVTSGLDLWIGRGLGGAYNSVIRHESPYGLHMVHYGPLHLILKGGIILLVLLFALVSIPVASAIASRSRPPELGFTILFLFMNITHTQFIDVIAMGLFATSLAGLGLQQSRYDASKSLIAKDGEGRGSSVAGPSGRSDMVDLPTSA